MGLADPADYGFSAYGGRAYPGVTSYPRATPLFRGRGSAAPFFRLPALTGLRQPRFGLEPLMLRLGLSPQPSAFTGGRGAVPVGRPGTRLSDLTPAQQLEVVRRRVEEGVIDPRGLPAEVRAALARGVPTARGGFPTPTAAPRAPGGAQELALGQRAIGEARTLAGLMQAGAAPTALSPEVQAALQAHRTGERMDLGPGSATASAHVLPETPFDLSPEDLAFLASPEFGQIVRPEFAPGIPSVPVTPEALQAGQVAETADLTPTGDLLNGLAPVLSGLSTAGGLASAGMAFVNRRPGPGILGLAGTAGSIPALAKMFPDLFSQLQPAQAASVIAPAAEGIAASAPSIMTAAGSTGADIAASLGEQGLGDVGDVASSAGDLAGSVGNAGDVLQGVGNAAGLANIGMDISKGDAVGALRNSIVLAAQAFGPEVGIPVAIGNALISMFTGGKSPHTKGSDIMLPGFSGPVHTRTAGGTNTMFSSFREGTGAARAFMPTLSGATSFDELATALNANPQPNRFNIGAWGELGGGRGVPSNRTDEPSERRFTAADFQDPDIIKNLTVQAGAMGAPADRPDIVADIRRKIDEIHTREQVAPFLASVNEQFPGQPATFEDLFGANELARTQGTPTTDPAFLGLLTQSRDARLAAERQTQAAAAVTAAAPPPEAPNPWQQSENVGGS